jgi:hypothetical protein
MSDPKLLKPELIHLLEFRLIKGKIDSPFEFKMSNIENYNLNVEFEMGFNHAEKLVRSDFSVNVTTISKEKSAEEATANYQFAFIFNVENLDELVVNDETGMKVNSNLGNAIASITYSTSRGILLSRFMGTVMQDFMLPVINPNELLNKKEQKKL